MERSLSEQNARCPRLEDLFDDQLHLTADAPAITDGNLTLTYADVHRASNRVAAGLRQAGVRPNDFVGLSMRRTVWHSVSVLGSLRAGATYVPLDAGYPAERLSYMIGESGLICVLSDALDRPKWLPDTVKLLHIGPAGAGPDEELVAPQECMAEADPDGVAYVIFTSGSTGRPKGVAMPHRPLINLVRWQAGVDGLGQPARTLQFMPLSFDVSFQEIFTTWTTGGCLVTVDEETRRDPIALVEHIAARKVERLYVPFVALDGLCQEICRGRIHGLPLQDVIATGEQLRVTPAIREAFDGYLNARLHNQYGPSETHVVAGYTLSDRPAAWPVLPPIGQVAGGAILHVLDSDSRRPVPEGETGELFVGGEALADGYVNRPDLTAERFFDIPGLGRVYQTGDFVRCGSDGNLEFVGRRDDQVKIRGYRVELGEVEAALDGIPGIAQAAVAVERDSDGQARLVAHIVLHPTVERLNHQGVRRALSEIIPDFMVPAQYIEKSVLPVTPSGKIDRRSLSEGSPAEAYAPTERSEACGHQYEVQQNVLQMLRELLTTDELQLTDNFFDFGGNSLLAVQLSIRISESLGVSIPVRTIFAADTIADLAHEVGFAIEGPAPLRSRNNGALGARPEQSDNRASMAQERAVLSAAKDGSAPLFQFHIAYWLSGEVKLEVLRRAAEEVCKHHPSLRVRFSIDGTEVRQVVVDDVRPEVRVLEYSDGPREEREQRALQLLEAEVRRPFDRASGARIRLCVVRVDAQRHALAIILDHLTADGWSLNLIARDLSEAYTSIANGAVPRLKPGGSVLRWADEQRRDAESGRLDAVAQYWLSVLGPETSALTVALPGYRGDGQLVGSSAVTTEVPPELLDVLDDAARVLRSTPYCLGMAALKVLVSRETGRERVTVLTTTANRELAEHQNTVGWFANGIFPTTTVDFNSTFRRLVESVQVSVREALTYGDIPAAYVRARMWPGYSLGFRKDPGVYFMYSELWGDSLDLPRVHCEPVLLDDWAYGRGLQAWMHRTGQRLILRILHYVSEYPVEFVERFSHDFLELLSALSGNVDLPIIEVVRGCARPR